MQCVLLLSTEFRPTHLKTEAPYGLLSFMDVKSMSMHMDGMYESHYRFESPS